MAKEIKATTSVTFSGISKELLKDLNDRVSESGKNRADFLADLLNRSTQQDDGLLEQVNQLQQDNIDLRNTIDNLLEKVNQMEMKQERLKLFYIPDRLGVILRELIKMPEVKEVNNFREGINYILDPYWRQQRLVTTDEEMIAYKEWKQKYLSNGISTETAEPAE